MYLDFADKFNVLIGSEGAVGKSSTSSVVESSKAEVVINVGALKAGCQLGKIDGEVGGGRVEDGVYKEAEGEQENATLPFTALCGEENSVCVSDKVTKAVWLWCEGKRSE
jgi:hypothetical protein